MRRCVVRPFIQRFLVVSVCTIVTVGVSPVAMVAQDTTQARRDSLRRVGDSLRVDSLVQPIDTSQAARLGLPTAPSRSFPTADSIIQALMKEEGYRSTRYASDSVSYVAATREIFLTGSALVEREGTTLEADSVQYFQEACSMRAGGDPKLFEGSTILVGEGMVYDACKYHGLVARAFTSFNQSGVEWFLRGGLGIDSAATRLYAGNSSIYSCDLEVPHYHFAAGKIKWVSNNFLVARPATLYLRDVPIMWFPFIFQDMREGRRSGLLTPRFGINDLVRPNQGYQRHVTNVGYYVVLNDYMDLQASLDWLSGSSISFNGQLQYQWLTQFMQGALSVSRRFESSRTGGGRRSTGVIWNHTQRFNQRTSLNARVNFESNTSFIEDNSVDPLQQTAQLTSSVNFQKQFGGGNLSLGGTRSQNLNDAVIKQVFPTISFTPAPISIGGNITWTPSFNFTSDLTSHQFGGVVPAPPVNGTPQVDSLLFDTRRTSLSINTPIRLGSWNWTNSITINDEFSDRREALAFPDPTDSSQTVNRVYAETFSTGIDWNTSINLPLLFPSTFKLQPSFGISNATTGPFLLRNRYTNGRFVQQGKRPSFGLGVSPTLFGFFPGIGPIARIRHTVALQVRWTYQPPASVNPDYLRAIDPTGSRPTRRSPLVNRLSFGLSQTFEGKYAQAPGDSADPRDVRKLKLLNWQMGSIEYDFEQAKQPGMRGWVTQSINNSFTSDLLPGFRLSVTHELWKGAASSDTASFDPFLTAMSASFTLRGSTIKRLFNAITGGEPLAVPEETPADTLRREDRGQRPRMSGPQTSYRSIENLTAAPPPGSGFQASITYNDQRRRPIENATSTQQSANLRTMGLDVSFTATKNWSVSWRTQYNFTTKEFTQHQLGLNRDLHRWRATFGFTRAPNGNFAFTFFVNLIDEPEIKFNYDQQTIR
jgi:lipopolysaccharide assembly outer membrane protein LptD (OstA)